MPIYCELEILRDKLYFNTMCFIMEHERRIYAKKLYV